MQLYPPNAGWIYRSKLRLNCVDLLSPFKIKLQGNQRKGLQSFPKKVDRVIKMSLKLRYLNLKYFLIGQKGWFYAPKLPPREVPRLHLFQCGGREHLVHTLLTLSLTNTVRWSNCFLPNEITRIFITQFQLVSCDIRLY